MNNDKVRLIAIVLAVILVVSTIGSVLYAPYLALADGSPLIQKQTVIGASVSSISLTNLNLVKGKLYRLVVAIMSDTTGNMHFKMHLNGDTDPENYGYTVVARNYDTPTDRIHAFSYNSDFSGDNHDQAAFSMQIYDLVIAPNGWVYLVSHGAGNEWNHFEVCLLGAVYTGSVSSVTQIDWLADMPHIAAGSFLAVYETE